MTEESTTSKDEAGLEMVIKGTEDSITFVDELGTSTVVPGDLVTLINAQGVL